MGCSFAFCLPPSPYPKEVKGEGRDEYYRSPLVRRKEEERGRAGGGFDFDWAAGGRGEGGRGARGSESSVNGRISINFTLGPSPQQFGMVLQTQRQVEMVHGMQSRLYIQLDEDSIRSPT